MHLFRSALSNIAASVALLAGLGLGCTHPSVPLQSPGPAAQTNTPAQPPAGPIFVSAQSSDDWVLGTFQIQTKYTRVLLVDAGAAPAKTVRVRPLHLNARAQPSIPPSLPSAGPSTDLTVDHVYHTLQQAADAALGGDLVAVAPGAYTGFCLNDKPSANQDRYIHFLALGSPGEVTINQPCPEDKARWMIYLRAAHHIVIQGFQLKGAETPGDTNAKGPWAGIMLDGDFGRTGKLTHHVAFIENFSHHHAAWGLHSTDSHSVLLQNNVFGFSAREHSAYVSDGSDNYVIRRNVFQGSRSSGLQLNLDPEASLKETVSHPSLSTLPPYSETRLWAETVIKRAGQVFGERGFPDGRGEHFIIEDNVITGNGRGGGGALNLAAFQHSIVQNNLIYGNRAHGIAQWDNRNPFDKDAVASPPETAADAKDPAKLPLFGCRNNVFQHNTVLLSNPGRAAMLIVNGSYNTHLYNNIFINGADASIDIDRTSALGFDASGLVFGEVRYRSEPFGSLGSSPYPPAVLSVMLTSPTCSTCQPNVSRAAIESEFEGPSEEPWIIVEGNWWVLNPKRPNFRPKWGATTLRGKADNSHFVEQDMEGVPRTSADIGALTAVGRNLSQ